MLATNSIASFYHLKMIDEEMTSKEEPIEELAILLDSFKDVFQKSVGLPPSRISPQMRNL